MAVQEQIDPERAHLGEVRVDVEHMGDAIDDVQLDRNVLALQCLVEMDALFTIERLVARG